MGYVIKFGGVHRLHLRKAHQGLLIPSINDLSSCGVAQCRVVGNKANNCDKHKMVSGKIREKG